MYLGNEACVRQYSQCYATYMYVVGALPAHILSDYLIFLACLPFPFIATHVCKKKQHKGDSFMLPSLVMLEKRTLAGTATTYKLLSLSLLCVQGWLVGKRVGGCFVPSCVAIEQVGGS